VLALLLASCAPPTLYDWGNYSQSMYNFYRDDNQAEQYIAALHAVITTNETAGKRVPPGIYAEYGYMMMSSGQTAEAVAFFEKEKRFWPESELFMNTMIKNVVSGGKLPAPPVKTAPVDGAPPAGNVRTGV
jgi:hypothetical protein